MSYLSCFNPRIISATAIEQYMMKTPPRITIEDMCTSIKFYFNFNITLNFTTKNHTIW